MIKKKIGAVICAIGLVYMATGFTKIAPGYVGVVYNMKGGVEDTVLTQGMKYVFPWKHVNKYSVATEQAYLSRDAVEGSKDDDSFSIPTSDGKTVNVDLEFSYHFDADRLPSTFTTFKGQSGKDIEQTFIRGKIKAWASEVSSTFSVLDIYGEKRAELNAQVLQHIKDRFDAYGIIIDSVNFSRIELDDQTAQAIQNKINKQQELEAAKLETQKAEETAKKQLIEAQAEADAEVAKAKGQAEANRELQSSITPELIQMKEAEARLKHGWVTVQGADTVVTNTSN